MRQVAVVRLCAAFVLLALASQAIEIATGKMLGAGYDIRAFYTRQRGGKWEKTYSEPKYRPESAGRLMNLRIAQGLFEDEWLTETPFNPRANTKRLIAALDVYKAHGILAVNVSLQGGNPGYNREQKAITREYFANAGPAKGALISAFREDGSLKPAWLARLLELARALDKRGMVLNLMYFYQGQDEVLRDPDAIRAAVRNATDWLIDNDVRNVIIKIANEHDIRGFDHERFIDLKMDELIELARSRFAVKRASWRAPIGASTGGSMRVFERTARHADLTIVHGNGRPLGFRLKRMKELFDDASMPGPIYMNEDDNGRETTQSNLAKELAACDEVWDAGGSWGYMPWRQVQMFPFSHYMPGRSGVVRDEMDLSERDAAYFKAVLEHIRGKVLR